MTLRRTALGIILSLAVLYAASPWLAARLLPPLLTRWGIEESHFDFGYPRFDAVDVTDFSARAGGATIVGGHARIAYELARVWRGDVDSVVIDELSIHLAHDLRAPDSASRSFEMPAFWTLVPARRLTISKLAIASEQPRVSALGSVSLDPDVLQIRSEIDSPLLSMPLLMHGAVNPDGRVALTVMEPGASESLAALTGVPDVDRRTMNFDGHLSLAGAPLALVGAYLNATVESGSVRALWHGRAPWPLPPDAPWQKIVGDGRYEVSLAGATPDITHYDVQLAGALHVADGGVEAHVDSGSAARFDYPRLAVLAGGDIGEHVELTTDQDVAIAYARRAVRIGDGVILTAGGATKPIQLRIRGTLDEQAHFQLGIVALDGTPIVLATGAFETDVLAVKTRVALNGRLLHVVAAAGGLAATGGHLVADFDGTLRWPPVAELGLQNVSGKGRVNLALTARIGPQRLMDVAFEGDYTRSDGPLEATVDPGAHVVLALDGVDLSTISPIVIRVPPDRMRVAVAPFDFRLALPPIHVGRHKIVIGNAWVTTEGVTFENAAVTASAVVRTHAGRDALPTRATLSHDLSSGRGSFELAGEWQVKNAVLATQLPGFQAPYDLDEGAIEWSLAGRWDASGALDYDASGHVRVTGRRAHYKDYAISGLAADFPVTFNTKGFSVHDAPLSIDRIDVGFPLTGISLGLSVDDGIARIHGLSGSLLGGGFAANAFSYDIASDKTSLDVDLTGISLAEVLALEGGDVRGSGVLDAKLPVAIDGDNFTIGDGNATARAPGGTLIYKGAPVPAAVAQSGFGFAIEALQDFRYDTLDAKVGLATDGALTLGVRLQGSNPAVEQGRAIQFNLNLNESLPALLESLRAAGDVTNRIEQRFAR